MIKIYETEGVLIARGNEYIGTFLGILNTYFAVFSINQETSETFNVLHILKYQITFGLGISVSHTEIGLLNMESADQSTWILAK